MLKKVVTTLLGMLLGIPVLGYLFVRFFSVGFKLFKVKKRTSPPKIMLDKELGEHKYMDVNGVKLHYVESGDPSKPLMVFVHGYPECWFSWRHQIKFFKKKYHCVAFDMRGYGESSKPSGISNYLIALLVEDLRQLVVNLGYKKFHMVAHDWGGGVGWYFSAKHPEMVETYSACNIPHIASLREQQQSSLEQMAKSWYMLFFQCPILPELLCMANDIEVMDRMAKEANLSNDKEGIEAYKYSFRDFKTWNRTINYYRGALQSQPEKNMMKALVDIKVPSLLVFGTEDKYLSVTAAENSKKFVRDFRLEWVPGASHWVQQEAHEQVNNHINNFLQSRASSS